MRYPASEKLEIIRLVEQSHFRTGIHARRLADCAKILDALKDPVAGFYDPRDPYTTVPRSSVLATPYAQHVNNKVRAGGARRPAPRHHPRVDGLPAGASKTEEPIVVGGSEGDQDGARRATRRHASRVVRSAVATRSRHRADEGRLYAARWRNSSRFSCPISSFGSAATAGRSSRNSPRRSRRPSSHPARSSGPAPCSRSIIASRWRKAASNRRPIWTSAPFSSRSWRTPSASIFPSI